MSEGERENRNSLALTKKKNRGDEIDALASVVENNIEGRHRKKLNKRNKPTWREVHEGLLITKINKYYMKNLLVY